MENVIEKLRELIGEEYEGSAWDDTHDNVDAILALKSEGYTSKRVSTTFEDGGRWTNWKTDIYRVEQDGKVAHFSVCREVPATECQDGGDFALNITEVVPQEVTVIEYVSGRAA